MADPINQSETQSQFALNGQNLEQILLCSPIILTPFLNSVHHADLQSLRLTSRTWNHFVSTHLLKTITPPLTFKYSYDYRTYHLTSTRPDQDKTLLDFLSCLSSSPLFPCNNFVFPHGWKFTLADSEWKDQLFPIFSLIGHQIKKFKIGSTDQINFFTIDLSILRSILLDLAPNIQNLELPRFYNLNWDDSNKLNLPALKTLTCFSCGFIKNSTVLDMIGYAPRLSSLYNFKVYYIKEFLSKFKITAIKKLDPHYTYDWKFLDNFKIFAVAQPQLKSVFLPRIIDQEISGDFVKILNCILQSSQNSLQKLEATTLDSKGLIIPQLPNVTELEFKHETHSIEYKFFPGGMDLSSVFPRVTSLKWRLTGGPRRDWSKVLPEGSVKGSFDKVKSLTLLTYELSDALQKIPMLAPNVTRLIVHNWRWREDDLTRIFDCYPDLEQLTLVYRQRCWELELTDTFFTGIPQDKFGELRDRGKQEDLRKVRTGRGIMDFTKLKDFKIKFHNESWADNIAVTFPSGLSGIYGFSKEGLQVTVAYNQKCLGADGIRSALAPIAPFVTFRHEAAQKEPSLPT